MSCTINGISLHDQTRWLDEFSWSRIERHQTRSVSGNLIIQTTAKTGGRPMTLDCRWIDRATLTQLEALRDSTTITEFTVILPGSRNFTCAFAAVTEPLTAIPLQPHPEYENEDLFEVVLYLITT